jgi:hypothetical protein
MTGAPRPAPRILLLLAWLWVVLALGAYLAQFADYAGAVLALFGLRG